MQIQPLRLSQHMLLLALLAAWRDNRSLEVLRLLNLLNRTMPEQLRRS